MDTHVQKYAPVILRLGLAMVFLWFGITQLQNQAMWIGFIPTWIISMSGLTATTIVILNGMFEVMMAVLLAFGIQIRIVSFLLSIHLLTIIGDVGLSAVGIRDVGLFFALLSITFHGADEYSYDKVQSI